MNGEPLPADHGFPARLIVPGLFGYVSATKWLTEIELTTLGGVRRLLGAARMGEGGPILTQSRIDVPRDGARLDAGTGADRRRGVGAGPRRQRGRGAGRRGRLAAGRAQRRRSRTRRGSSSSTAGRRTPGDHSLRVRATDGDGEVQTDERTRPAPDGARGHHTIRVSVG